MGLTNFPNGLQTSVVVAPGLVSSLGQTFFVNSGVPAPLGVGGQDGLGNDGLSPQRPFLTIQRAVDACVSGRGDTIYVYGSANAYAESVIVTKDFITMIGIPAGGYARPDVDPTTGLGSKRAITVSAQGFVCQHMRFVGEGAGGTGAYQEGNGYIYNDCVFDGTSFLVTALALAPNVDDDSLTASEGLVTNCLMRNSGIGITFFNPGPPAGVGVTDVVIDNCRFSQLFGIDINDTYTAGGNNQTFGHCIIRNCQFEGDTKVTYIDLSEGSANSGLICNNWFASRTALTSAQIKFPGAGAGEIEFVGNYSAVGITNGTTF